MKTKALGVAAATTRAEARKHSIHRHHCRADGLWDCPLHRHENTEQEALHLRRQGPGEWGVEAVGQCEGCEEAVGAVNICQLPSPLAFRH
ncbi:MAG: hypothetical protein F6K42_17955 [Leptolyngbya sp. SIO1D8]|nr:hypothetical protein [Leptolyngbya sp. SIO1D8]